MTDSTLMETGGWEVKSKSECGGTFFITVSLVAVEKTYNYDRVSVETEWYEFDHDPTTEELQAAIDADGFDPTKPSCPTLDEEVAQSPDEQE